MDKIHEAEKATQEENADKDTMLRFMTALDDAIKVVHKRNHKWWISLETGEPIKRNVGELLMLIVSEVAEGMEGHRKNLQDDKLPRFPMITVELADAIIRIMDLAGGLGLELPQAWYEKMQFNYTRIDHTRAHRLGEHGKKY